MPTRTALNAALVVLVAMLTSGSTGCESVAPAALLQSVSQRSVPTFDVRLPEATTGAGDSGNVQLTHSITDGQVATRLSTSDRVAVIDVTTATATGASSPVDCKEVKSQWYTYSFLLAEGTVTINPDRTLTLESGDLYINSTWHSATDAASTGSQVQANRLLALYPLFAKAAIQGGSVLTRYAILCKGNTDLVRVSLRSDESNHSVWVSKKSRECPDRWSKSRSETIECDSTIGSSLIRRSTQVEEDRYKQLEEWAKDLGVH